MRGPVGHLGAATGGAAAGDGDGVVVEVALDGAAAAAGGLAVPRAAVGLTVVTPQAATPEASKATGTMIRLTVRTGAERPGAGRRSLERRADRNMRAARGTP
jgi:hypothetical protein